jgi:TatD DNase family protein
MRLYFFYTFAVPMELTDTHCHIYLPEFDADRTPTLERAFGAGVTRIFLPNVDRSTAPSLMELAASHPQNCFPMMGLHPTSVNESFEDELGFAEEMLNRHSYFGIGETGIDLYWDTTYREQQEEALRIQMGWAAERGLPLVIHTRNSHAETVSLITRAALPGLKGIFHCFSGTADQAREITGLGFHLGIGGVSTFKNSGLAQVLPGIDPKWILLETDAPYLAPVPFRGKRNEPAYIAHTAAQVAGIYGMGITELAAVTTENSKRLFGI